MTDNRSRNERKNVDMSVYENRCIYLKKLIIMAEERNERLAYYINEYAPALLKSEDILYINARAFFDLAECQISYLLNVFGDSEGDSLSYKNYRERSKAEGFNVLELDEKTNECLREIKKDRCFWNHIPASILSEDMYMLNSDAELHSNMVKSLSTIQHIKYKYYDRDEFEQRVNLISLHYWMFDHMIKCMKKELEFLEGKEITDIEFLDEVYSANGAKYIEKVMKEVQKVEFTIPEEWIDRS